MKGLNTKYKAILRSRKKVLWFSTINALILVLICYFADNLKYSVLSGPSVGQRIEQFREVSGMTNDIIPDDYVFINIAYDRQLVPVFDEFGLPQGEIDITDRRKLTSFLNQLKNTHKYVIVDVLLSDRYKSRSDSILTDALLKTDKLSISQSSTANLIDKRLEGIAGYTDYASDILETNFVKYQFLKDGSPTMPYMAYLSINPRYQMHSFGPVYWSNGHLCWNSLTLRFPIKLWNDPIVDNNSEEVNWQEKKVLNLGADILDLDIDIPSLVKDKIVVIGDFTEDDIHDTYIGKVAGPVININALEALRNNELEIPWTLILFLMLFYTAVTFFTIRQPKVSANKILTRLHLNTTFIKYVLSFIGYSFLLYIVGGFIYLFCGIDINIIIPSVWFTFLKGYTNTFAS